MVLVCYRVASSRVLMPRGVDSDACASVCAHVCGWMDGRVQPAEEFYY